MEKAIQELISRIESKDYSSLDSLKREISKRYKLNKFPSNIDILEHLDESNKEIFKNILLSKPVRTLSGVAPIAVMTKPIACAHGKCTFCPGESKSNFGDVPQSYTGNEPSLCVLYVLIMILILLFLTGLNNIFY